ATRSRHWAKAVHPLRIFRPTRACEGLESNFSKTCGECRWSVLTSDSGATRRGETTEGARHDQRLRPDHRFDPSRIGGPGRRPPPRRVTDYDNNRTRIVRPGFMI